MVIALLALLIIGPEKLPEMMKKLARVVFEVRRAGEEVRMHIDPDGDLYRATHFPPDLDFPSVEPDVDDEPIDVETEATEIAAEVQYAADEQSSDDPEK